MNLFKDAFCDDLDCCENPGQKVEESLCYDRLEALSDWIRDWVIGDRGSCDGQC